MNNNLKKLFPSSNKVRMNHGSFGLSPLMIEEELNKLRNKYERDFLEYFENKLFDDYEAAKKSLAKLINCPVEGLGFLRNATHGLETALSSISRAVSRNLIKVSKIITTNHEYSSTQIMLKDYAEILKVPLIEIEIDNLLTAEITEKILKEANSSALLVMSHITSPWSEEIDIASIIKKSDASCNFIIDAAHTLGSLTIDEIVFERAIISFTLHKWAYFPRGTGALYVPQKLRKLIKPLVHSWFYNEDFEKRFFWVGTENLFPYLVAGKVLEFHQILKQEWDKGKELKAYLLATFEEFKWMKPVKANEGISNMAAWTFESGEVLASKKKFLKDGYEIWLGKAGKDSVLRISLPPYITKNEINKLKEYWLKNNPVKRGLNEK